MARRVDRSINRSVHKLLLLEPKFETGGGSGESPAVASPESPFPSDRTTGWVSYDALLQRLGRVGSL